MKRLVSRLKSLKSGGKHPVLGDQTYSSAAPSSFACTPTPPPPPPPPQAKRSQPERQEELQNPVDPLPHSLESLPVEIQTAILANMTSLEALRSLIHASPRFYHVYAHNRLQILRFVLGHILDGIFVDAYAACRSGIRGLVPFYFDDYTEQWLVTSTRPTPKDLSLTEATIIASFHLSVIEPLTNHYAHWALNALSTSPGESPLSRTEKARIQRAMYRLQTICHIFNPWPNILLEQLYSFAPWESEEILCVHAFAAERYSSVLFMAAQELDGNNSRKYKWIRLRDDFEDLTLFQDEGMNEGNVVNILSKGLEPLVEVFNAKNNQAVISVFEDRLDFKTHICDFHWINSAVYDESRYDERHDTAYTEHDEAQDKRQKMPFEQDSLASPPIAWIRFWNGIYCNLIGLYIPDSLRRWGYVMWDAKRLEKTAAMEFIDLEWEYKYGERGISSEDDPRNW